MTPRSINTHRYMISKCSLKRSPFPASETHLAAASLSTGTVKKIYLRCWSRVRPPPNRPTWQGSLCCESSYISEQCSHHSKPEMMPAGNFVWDFLWRFPLLSLKTGACRRTIRLIMFLVISNDLVCSGRRVELNYSRDHPVTSHSSQYWVSDGFNSAVAFILTAPEHVESHLSDSEKCSPPE